MSKKIVLMTIACAEALRALKTVPAGELYARVMPHMHINEFNVVVDTLCRAKLITQTNNVLTWIGPSFADEDNALNA